MLRQAFKEWAVICAALAQGRQSLILRKGGIEEIGPGFQVKHERFWLFPTYVHQQETGVIPTVAPLLREVQRLRPPDGVLRLSHFAEVHEIRHVTDLDRLLDLEGQHIWSPETLRQRFHYRRPGLFVLTVRVFSAPVTELPNLPAYEGCKSWVELDTDLPTEPATPILDESAWRATRETIQRILR